MRGYSACRATAGATSASNASCLWRAFPGTLRSIRPGTPLPRRSRLRREWRSKRSANYWGIRIYGLRRFMRPSPTRNSTAIWSVSRNASIRYITIPIWKKSGNAFEDRFTYTQKFTQLTHSLKTSENTRKQGLQFVILLR